MFAGSEGVGRAMAMAIAFTPIETAKFKEISARRNTQLTAD